MGAASSSQRPSHPTTLLRARAQLKVQNVSVVEVLCGTQARAQGPPAAPLRSDRCWLASPATTPRCLAGLADVISATTWRAERDALDGGRVDAVTCLSID